MSVGIKPLSGAVYETVMGQVGIEPVDGPLYPTILGSVGLAAITGQIGMVTAVPEPGDYPYWPVGYWAVGNPYWPVGNWPSE